MPSPGPGRPRVRRDDGRQHWPTVPSHTFWADTRPHMAPTVPFLPSGRPMEKWGPHWRCVIPAMLGALRAKQSPLHCPARTLPSSWPAAPHSSWQPKGSSSSTDLTGSPSCSELPKVLGPIPAHTAHSLPPPALPEPLEESSGILELITLPPVICFIFPPSIA